MLSTVAVTKPNDRVTSVDGFRDWLHENGAKLNGIFFAGSTRHGGGTGAFVYGQHSFGDIVLSLPPKLVLTAENVCKSLPGLEKMRQLLVAEGMYNPATLDALLLSLALVHFFTGGESVGLDLTSFVAQLPKPGTVDVPQCWAPQTLDVICGTPVHCMSVARKQWLRDLTSSLPSLLQRAGMHSCCAALQQDENILVWADALVWSRSVCLPRPQLDSSHSEGHVTQNEASDPVLALSLIHI